MILILTAGAAPADALTDRQIYRSARQYASQGRRDFAFMEYRKIIRGFPGSRYRSDALFASGEYHYLANDYPSAQEQFAAYLEGAREPVKGLFAMAYLYRMAGRGGGKAEVSRLTKNIIAFQRQAFIFTRRKENHFVSPLGRGHSAAYEIDRIQFFIEGELFAEINF
jgi:tetratricopeptide (TPR) repeat protein